MFPKIVGLKPPKSSHLKIRRFSIINHHPFFGETPLEVLLLLDQFLGLNGTCEMKGPFVVQGMTWG